MSTSERYQGTATHVYAQWPGYLLRYGGLILGLTDDRRRPYLRLANRDGAGHHPAHGRLLPNDRRLMDREQAA